MSFSLSRKPEFTPSQIERFANIFDNLGQVFFGVLILTPLVEGIDKFNPLVLVLGTIAVGTCWTGSIILSSRKDRKKHDI